MQTPCVQMIILITSKDTINALPLPQRGTGAYKIYSLPVAFPTGTMQPGRVTMCKVFLTGAQTASQNNIIMPAAYRVSEIQQPFNNNYSEATKFQLALIRVLNVSYPSSKLKLSCFNYRWDNYIRTVTNHNRTQI